MSGNAKLDLLLKIANEYSEEKMDQAVALYRDPEVFYHFSPMRKNLVSWYDDWKDKKILEIGSECGALTSYFSRQAFNVTCLELLSDYQQVNQLRNRKRENITYITGTITELPDEKYDMVFIGAAFAKAALYLPNSKEDTTTDGSGTAGAQIALLDSLMKHLNKDGKLILAVENRMGFKYFAGAMEEYSGQYFGGIEGMEGVHGERTFTSAEMQDIFGKFPEYVIRTYYPYPDYCFPMTIYSPQFLPNKGELNLNGNDIARKRLHLFDETKAFDLIVEHGLFPYFSNSYLYIMEKGQLCKGGRIFFCNFL
jgi:hypothetical protein